ncbi:MAG: ATP-binding protein [Methylococcaceae bacterium]|nr:ATP-binding protein [Methylococcaceae bacterium]
MVFASIKPPLRITVLVVFGLTMLLSLHLMSTATQDASGLGEIYSLLVLVNSIGSVLLLALVIANVHELVRQVRKRKAGARLTLRMVFLFVLLSMAPASIVFYYSTQFLHHSIDSWFDVQIDRAMEDALELSQAALDQRMGELLTETTRMANSLAETPDSIISIGLEELRENSNAIDLILISKAGRIIASNSMDPSLIVPNLPDENILLQLKRGQSYVGLEFLGEEDLQVRALAIVPGLDPRYLQALYPVPLRIQSLTKSVETAHGRYKERNYLRDSLKLSFLLTLSLVLLLSMLAAIWVAFVSIRGIVAPVRNLALGTLAVGAGNYEQRLPVVSRDEWGFLVESFNEMTDRLAKARDETDRSRLEVEDQRAYLETVLGNLTSGVLSFDIRFRLRTANRAAEKILDMDFGECSGKRLNALISEHRRLADFVSVVQRRLEMAQSMWQEEVAILGRNGRQQLLCRGTPLFSTYGRINGAVMVFDDMTDLIRAQRNAAWGEVAQRLAHEIKNPLTPIQLSAERLKRKLKDRLDDEDAGVLDRATTTIVQQVEAMKSMVNAFSDYARPPRQQPINLNLNILINEVLALYPSQSGVRMEAFLDDEMPQVEVDPVRMRQVLHNLIKNATEALESVDPGRIVVSTRGVRLQGSNWIELRIEDNGPGISRDKADRIFDPYVTGKAKGTGLGLAIVKKIIEEHGGVISIDITYSHGAAFLIRLPANHAEANSGIGTREKISG